MYILYIPIQSRGIYIGIKLLIKNLADFEIRIYVRIRDFIFSKLFKLYSLNCGIQYVQ